MRIAIVIALAACSAREDVRPAAPAPPTAPSAIAAAPLDAVPPAPVATPDAPPPPDAAPARSRIELTFVGDLMFGGYFDDHYDPQYVERHDPLVDVDAKLASDLVFGNLETTIAHTLPAHGGPHDGHGNKRFVTLPERVAVLLRHGIHTVTVANNHQLDNGRAGLGETAAILGELGIAFFGGVRAELPRFRIEPLEVKGWRIGVIAATTKMNLSPRGALVPYVREDALRRELLPLITEARRDHDLVFVVLHWGYEYQDAPARWQIAAAHAFVDAGADAVIGHHPHVLQAIERYHGRVIAYSLGNFVFPNGKPRIRDTGVLRLGFAPRPAGGCVDLIAFDPAVQIRTPITHPVTPTPKQRAELARRLFALSAARGTTWRDDGARFVTEAACGDGRDAED